MSLRARLIIGVVALTTVGLIVAGAVTYAEQRDFLFDRADQQADAALPVVRREFEEQGIVAHAAGEPLDVGGPGGGPGGARPEGGPGRGPEASLSSAVYGEARDAAGKVLGHVTPRLPEGETAPAPPRLPADLAAGERRTVDAVQSGGPRYRVAAEPASAGGFVIAAVPISDVDASLSRLLRIEALVFGAVLLALGAGAWWIVRVGLRPLDAIGATAGAIAAGDLGRRVEPAEPRTEVGRLGLSLNAMLARLEEAFAERHASEERLRRFLADASHELRTPLASIRGYAELFRIGAAAEPKDVEKAMTRIEEESARMGVLVEDLLALARLDEVREQIRERVDLRELAGDAVDDARAVAPEREISLDAADAVVVDGDPGQLRQVFANLLRNAVVHTPAGTPIEVSVRAANGHATLAVRDFGPGLPTADPSELFHRFWRADPGRGRGRAGAGLGLAIVAGVVAAHGGRAGAANAPGGGARFEVVLPLRSGHLGSLPPVLRRILRRLPLVVGVLIVVAGVAYLVNEFALSDSESVAAVQLRVTVMRPGTFESAHPYAPYYVVPRARFRDPSELSRVARNKIVSNPESALSKGALAGSPQIVRLSLRASSDDPVTVEGVRFDVVSDARPLRGWYTALSGCMAQPVRRAQADLDSKRRRVRYVSVNGVVSRNLALEVGRSEPQVIELRASTKRRRVAWTAELAVRDGDANRSTVVVDDNGEPFRVTATRASRGYEPVYGATGITRFVRSSKVARGGSSC